jgi:hypothetical protein
MAQNHEPGDGSSGGAANLVSSAINLTTLLTGGANGEVLKLMALARERYDSQFARPNGFGDFKDLANGVDFASGANKMQAHVLESPALGFTSGPLNGQTSVRGFRLAIQQIGLTSQGAPTRLHELFIPFAALDNLNTTSIAGAVLFP